MEMLCSVLFGFVVFLTIISIMLFIKVSRLIREIRLYIGLKNYASPDKDDEEKVKKIVLDMIYGE